MKTMEAKKRDLAVSPAALRVENLVPAIVYAKGMDTVPVTVPENVVRSLWRDIKDKQEFTLDIEGSAHKVVLQDMQVHPVSGTVMHMDFLVLA